MFFLIRCVFWLTVVFSSMSWTVSRKAGPAAHPETPAPAATHALVDTVLADGAATAVAVKDVAVDEAVAWCVRSAGTCIADAARLTALVKASRGEDDPGAERDADHAQPDDKRGIAQQTARVYPVPRPDPRRHAVPKG